MSGSGLKSAINSRKFSSAGSVINSSLELIIGVGWFIDTFSFWCLFIGAGLSIWFCLISCVVFERVIKFVLNWSRLSSAGSIIGSELNYITGVA